MRLAKIGLIVVVFILTSGCASSGHHSDDPFESWNRKVYKFNKVSYDYVAKPVTQGYKAVTPDFVETGISNVFSNLNDVPNLFNNLFQGKPKESFSDLGRVLINSTLGIAGLWDPASSMGLIKHDEDFGQTLAVWGVDSGPFLMLPLLGPSSVRDFSGRFADSRIDPINQIKHIPTRNSLNVLELIDNTKQVLDLEEQLNAASDEYLFVRDVWLQNRKFKIFDGNIPLDDGLDCEDEDEDECEF